MEKSNATEREDMPLLLTLGQAAARVGVGEKMMRAMSHDDAMLDVIVHVGGRRMFVRDRLDEYIRDVFAGV